MAESSSRSKKSKQGSASTGFGPGDYVTNPLKPDWGPGRVVDLKRDIVYVYFRDRPGKEVIKMKQSGLAAGEPDPALAAIPAFIEKDGGFAVEKKRATGKSKRPARIVFDEPEIEEVEMPDMDLEEEGEMEE